ncbi:MAG TPA: hypothetical protein VMF57_14350 [Solirubrobacteraceae bacterium]|nr:hypothetical protein [Solirubrobacteraceae bacterium]
MSSAGQEPTEEELQAAYEAELKRLRVEHVLLDNVAALANLGMRRTGLAPGTESERDPDQVRLAIESIRALLPVLEQTAPAQIGAIRDAVSQLQLAFVRIGGQPGSEADAAQAGAAGPDAPGPGAPPSAGAPGAGPPGAGQPGAAQPGSGPPPPAPEPTKPGEPGPAQRSGRLWVPGQ